MQIESKHLAVIAVSLSAAVILAPVGVMAATGQLVNITDPSSAAHKARVGSRGTLHVESRAGVIGGSFNNSYTADTLESFTVAEAVAPERLAITEVSLGSVGPSNGTTTGHHYVDLIAYVQGTGTGACGTTSSGYTIKTLRRIVVRNFAPSIQHTWDGPPLVTPAAAAGKKVCVVLRVNTYTTGSVIYMGATGFRTT